MSSLKHQAARGVSWTTTSSAVLALLQIGQLAVLTRFLDPADFGLRALVTVVVGFVTAYADMGLGNAVVHSQETSDDQLSSLYWLNILVSIAAYGVILALMPLVVWFYDEPRLYALIPIGGLTFIVNAFYGIHVKLLEKELQFRSIAAAEIVGNVAGVASSIGMAVAGYGVLALIIGQLVVFAVRGIVVHVLYRGSWRPRLRFRFGGVRKLVGYGLYQTGERSVNFFSRNLDKLILGRVLGPEVLGLYSVASNLVLMPFSRINPLLTRVAFPVLSRVQHDTDRLRRGYLFVVRFITFVNYPLLVGLIAVADVFAPIFLGPEWADTAIIIQVLAVAAIIRGIGSPVSALILAKGNVHRLFFYNLVKVGIQIPAIYFASSAFGVPGLLIAVVTIEMLDMAANYWYLIKPVILVATGRFLATCSQWLVLAVPMGVIVHALNRFVLSGAGMTELLLLVVTGALLYVVLLIAFARPFLREVRSLFAKPHTS